MSKKIIITLLILITAVLFFLFRESNNPDDSGEAPQIVEVKPHQKEIPSELIDQIISPSNKGVALMEQYQSVDAVKEFEELFGSHPIGLQGG